MSRIQLSRNFFLDEFTQSQTASRIGREIEVTPDGPVHLNLKRLCHEVLQPIRDELGPVHITSGYRPSWLNELIGGSERSAHLKGLAADFVVAGTSPYQVSRFIVQRGLPVDQVIHEFGRWTHVGIKEISRAIRYQDLTAHRVGGRTVYTPGIHKLEDLADG